MKNLVNKIKNKATSAFVRLEMAKNEAGQGLTEYALIVAFIAIAVVGVMTLLGTELDSVFNDIINDLGTRGSVT